MEFTLNTGIITGIGGLLGLLVAAKTLGIFKPWFVKSAKAEDLVVLKVQLEDHSVRVEDLGERFSRVETRLDTVLDVLTDIRVNCGTCKGK
jgi:hypothetical protein